MVRVFYEYRQPCHLLLDQTNQVTKPCLVCVFVSTFNMYNLDLPKLKLVLNVYKQAQTHAQMNSLPKSVYIGITV